MRRIVSLLFLTLFLLILALPAMAQTNKEITVTVDGLPVQFDTKPIVQNNCTLVPFRALAEAINVPLTWDQATQTINAGGTKQTITLQIGNPIAYKNGTPIKLEVPPQVIQGKTLIPLRFFSEALQCQVGWQSNAIAITSPPQAMEILGYYALGDKQTSSWTNLFGKAYPEVSQGNTDVVNTLSLGWYSLDQTGQLLTKSRTGWQRPDDYDRVLTAAKQYQLKTEMLIHLTDEDRSLTNLLNDPAACQRAVEAITAEAANYQSVNLDFEGLGYSDTGENLIQVQNSFTNFVALLAQELKPLQIELALSLHAPNSAYKGYDYKKLGQLADNVIVMAYDYGTKPEPLQQVNQAIQRALTVVPPDKLVLGISVPNETPESLANKIGLAKHYKLQGIALWRLGLVSNDMWGTLRNNILTH